MSPAGLAWFSSQSMLWVSALVTVSVFVERALWFRRTAFDPEELFALLDEQVRTHDVAGAITQCTLLRAPLVRVVLAGLTHLHRGDVEVRAAVAQAVLREVPRAERRVAWLATIAQVAALLGFLATLAALMIPWPSDYCWNHEAGPTIDPPRKAAMLACSISESLHTTQLGLLVALVAGAGYALFRAQARARERELDAAAAWVIALADTHRAVDEPAVVYR